jgi:hypothetical protein
MIATEGNTKKRLQSGALIVAPARWATGANSTAAANDRDDKGWSASAVATRTTPSNASPIDVTPHHTTPPYPCGSSKTSLRKNVAKIHPMQSVHARRMTPIRRWRDGLVISGSLPIRSAGKPKRVASHKRRRHFGLRRSILRIISKSQFQFRTMVHATSANQLGFDLGPSPTQRCRRQSPRLCQCRRGRKTRSRVRRHSSRCYVRHTRGRTERYRGPRRDFRYRECRRPVRAVFPVAGFVHVRRRSGHLRPAMYREQFQEALWLSTKALLCGTPTPRRLRPRSRPRFPRDVHELLPPNGGRAR